nr:receptor-like protein kinase HSL1 [Ziziphus jujuba var. spinosa]
MIKRYKKKHALRPERMDFELTRLNFEESQIMSGLTESKVIGRGGSGKVYRVSVNNGSHGDDVFAVKQIRNDWSSEKNFEKQFNAEVKVLRSIRHPNVVQLIDSFSSDNFKFLVYEYLPHMSLDRWLHYENEASSSTAPHGVLDWTTRKKIVIGAAHGLSYMHHDCVPPIVHRDIKSSNILLDLNFNAKIADFGLAKLMVKRGQPLSVSALAGSPGYFAPEYQRTLRVNEKTDVYSFGVVLLELVTGRQAHRGDENTCLAEWAWRHLEQGKAIVDALDEKIKQPCYIDEIRCVFNLGLNCTQRKPSARPSMKKVIHLLLKCGQ